MKNTLRIIMTISCAMVGIVAVAKSHEETHLDSIKQSHKVIVIDKHEAPNPDSLKALLDIYYYDQFRHAQDPKVPYFLFMSKNNNLVMGIGGLVKVRGWYDWGGVVNNSGFYPYDILVPRDNAHRRKLDASAGGTALFFQVLGKHHTFGDYQLYIKGDFNGYQSHGFHLKDAYATINDWTVGYASSTFSDPVGTAPSVDDAGPSAYLQRTSVLIRWMHTFKDHWTIASSLELPDSYVGANDSTTETTNDWFPDIALFGQYQWANREHIRLSGILRVLPYRNLMTQTNKSIVGWGVQLSTKFTIFDPLIIYATVNTGKGYGSFSGDLSMGDFDLINNPNDIGAMYAPLSFAWLGGIQYYFTHNIFASATICQERLLPKYTIDPQTYKYGQYGAFNVFWDLTSRIEVAGEFNIGRRKNFNGESSWARRISILAQFSF